MCWWVSKAPNGCRRFHHFEDIVDVDENLFYLYWRKGSYTVLVGKLPPVRKGSTQRPHDEGHGGCGCCSFTAQLRIQWLLQRQYRHRALRRPKPPTVQMKKTVRRQQKPTLFDEMHGGYQVTYDMIKEGAEGKGDPRHQGGTADCDPTEDHLRPNQDNAHHPTKTTRAGTL